MILIKVLFTLFILPCVDVKVYIFNTVDSPSAELYDCILYDNLFYCRRPTNPIALNRSNDRMRCYHNGTDHSFSDLHQNNVNISTILHHWKSSVERVEQYLRYRRNESEPDGYLCHCTMNQSFGKNCEYLLPIGTTFAETLVAENSMKINNPQYVQFYGDIICYVTLECNSGLLCLDWRDICDGIQQCVSGLDEDNCDKLEFNECENDEYRCMNGMCIPEEYFLDGEFDCLDWSDEIQYYDDVNCPTEVATIQCDDRICPPNQFSCGDGQCILDRFEFQIIERTKSECRSRREQYFICETHYIKDMWTLPSGRCYEGVAYNESNLENHTVDEQCQYILLCDLSGAVEAYCPCGNNSFCSQLLNDTCRSTYISYPNSGIMAPYILFFYPTYYQLRPVSLWINGTINCGGILIYIPGIRYSFTSQLRQVEDYICQWAKNRSLLDNHTTSQHCHQHSLTFDNRSYSFTHICTKSQTCTSTYRINDGFENCMDKMDETANISITTICSKMQRYRFRCSPDEPTCLSITALGNLRDDCRNKFDERWLGTSTQLVDINCNKQWKDQCKILEQYIKNSWILNNTNDVTKQLRIPFRHYCDTFWNLALKEDENVTECRDWWICSDEQWQCDTGQCIDKKWVLDGEWDCVDASDEIGLFDRFISDRNLQVIPISMLMNRSVTLNRLTPLFSFCNLTTEFPCLRINLSNSVNNFEDSRSCISQHRIGDGHIDCYGAIDERNTITHCNQATMLGYSFKCTSTNDCIPYRNHCFGARCSNNSDDWFWCDHQDKGTSFCNRHSDSVCFNGTCVEDGRCNRVPDCSFGEDEYMCEYQTISKVTGGFYRKDKEILVKNTLKNLRLTRFPFDAKTTVPMSDSSTAPQTTQAETKSLNNARPIAYWCNRGVGVEMSNGSIGCYCPPQYYGENCQFHTDRITVLFHLDLSQSTYTKNSDIKIVLKILVLFLVNDKIITNSIFHARAVTELSVITKRIVHLLYSRSIQHPQHKMQRYVNQSDVVNDHSYSIRIEMYERTNSRKPLLIAVWKYPIYFDYLPVFRVAKILRLTKVNSQENPCSNNRCNQNEDCQPLMNDKSKYICLCKSNFTGENCSAQDDQCANGYCFPGSICKPDYQGLLIGNKFPYCICPFDYFGDRCDIEHDQCSITPCYHNGTCYTGSRPDSVSCLCTEEYYGRRCEFIKPSISLNLNESVDYVGAVLQYFDIDFISLNLILVRQQVYQTLPTVLKYLHEQKTAPEIILVKLYSSKIEVPAELYLISVHLNVTTISATTQLMEKNRCVHLHTFISDNQTQTGIDYSPIKYHYLCLNKSDLLCFRDDFYLCICDENHTRVECFRYDLKLDQCFHCLSGGRCLKGDRSESNKYLCLCPPCYSGANCQFNSNSFSFTLDQLFFTDLISKMKQKTILWVLIITPLLLFLFALPNNLFSIVTFRRQNCLCNGIGQYLLYMSVINQFNLGFLAGRLIHLSVNISGLHSHHSVDDYLCKILSYLLTSSSRIVYWLSSLVAIERVYMTIFLNGRWLRKPHIARRLVCLTIIVVLISNIHELIFVKSLFGIDNGNGGMCVIEFPINSQSTWLLFHLIVSIMNSILPFIINFCCTITISCVVAKKKVNTRKTVIVRNIKTKESHLANFRKHIRLMLNILSENKELIIGPGITLIPQLFSLPLFVISFTLYCQNLESSWVRYLLIASYFTSFIPQLTSFMLYVLPSSFYSREWHNTWISQWIFGLFRLPTRSDPITSKTSGIIE